MQTCRHEGIHAGSRTLLHECTHRASRQLRRVTCLPWPAHVNLRLADCLYRAAFKPMSPSTRPALCSRLRSTPASTQPCTLRSRQQQMNMQLQQLLPPMRLPPQSSSLAASLPRQPPSTQQQRQPHQRSSRLQMAQPFLRWMAPRPWMKAASCRHQLWTQLLCLQ